MKDKQRQIEERLEELRGTKSYLEQELMRVERKEKKPALDIRVNGKKPKELIFFGKDLGSNLLDKFKSQKMTAEQLRQNIDLVNKRKNFFRKG